MNDWTLTELWPLGSDVFYPCDLLLCVRDVLAVCLSIPHWIYSVNEKNKDRLSQLEPCESFHLSVPYLLPVATSEIQNQKDIF